jgi:pimeloyl-ACP methyl ester carboxylesterase
VYRFRLVYAVPTVNSMRANPKGIPPIMYMMRSMHDSCRNGNDAMPPARTRREFLINASIAAVAMGATTGQASRPAFAFQQFETNGISVRAAVEGSGPLVIMVHGFPELWYSWRHQIQPIVEAGFTVVVPDVRGYGGSEKPHPIDAYDMVSLTNDVVGLIDALGEETAILVGHDWGAPICWNTAALHPDRIAAVAGLSVPFFPRGDAPSIDQWNALYGNGFFYQLYFQEEGVAEAAFEANVRTALRQLYFAVSGDGADAPLHSLSSAQPVDDMLGVMVDPDPFPAWMTEEDLDYYTAAFEQGGFRSPLNRYRAQRLDWERLPQLSQLQVHQPSCFIAGTLDPVRTFIPGFDMYAAPGANCTDFRGSTLIEGKGHWIQQEAPAEVNRALLSFLATLG